MIPRLTPHARPAAGAAGPYASIEALLAAFPTKFSGSFIEVAKSAGLWDELDAAEGITLLVPSDAALEALVGRFNGSLGVCA
jgi:hypothetical protein